MGDSIERRVKEIIVDQVGCELIQITDKSTFEDLGVDSLDQIEIVMGCEEEWGIEIPDDQAEGFKTVDDLTMAVTSLCLSRSK